MYIYLDSTVFGSIFLVFFAIAYFLCMRQVNNFSPSGWHQGVARKIMAYGILIGCFFFAGLFLILLKSFRGY